MRILILKFTVHRAYSYLAPWLAPWLARSTSKKMKPVLQAESILKYLF